MTARDKTVSAFEIAKGALAFLPDMPKVLPSLANLALLRPQSRRSLGLLFQETAQKHAKRVFLRSGDQSWTYAQANAICNQMARGLMSMGISQGDTVGLLSANRPETLLAVIACAKLGAVAALLNINQQGAVQIHSLNLVKPRLLLAWKRPTFPLGCPPKGDSHARFSKPRSLCGLCQQRRLRDLASACGQDRHRHPAGGRQRGRRRAPSVRHRRSAAPGR